MTWRPDLGRKVTWHLGLGLRADGFPACPFLGCLAILARSVAAGGLQGALGLGFVPCVCLFVGPPARPMLVWVWGGYSYAVRVCYAGGRRSASSP